MPEIWIHKQMRRCMLSDAGTRNYYLDEDNSLLKQGTSFEDNQTAGASTSGLRVYGSFTAAVGQYLNNVTKGFSAYITAVGAGYVDCKPRFKTMGTNYGDATSTTASKLVDSSATFQTDGIQPGQVAVLRDLSDYAVITSVDSETQLSLSKDLFASGDKYGITPGFESGDTVQRGTARFDGTDGQCMVEIPKFYVRKEYNPPAHSWSVSAYPQAGYSLHPAFVKAAGAEADYLYVSAFEGADAADLNFNAPELTAKNLGSAQMCSLPDRTPVVEGQRGEFRQFAANRGAAWHQWNFAANWAVQLLFMLEHETFNSQSIFEGITNWSSSDRDAIVSNTRNRSVVQSGATLELGNASGSSSASGDAGSYFSYRGIENLYGNIWKYEDGINILDNHPYVAYLPEDFADDTQANYIDLGVTMPASNGYQKQIHDVPGLITAEVGAGSNTYLTDYYYQNPGWRVAVSGGYSLSGSRAGFAARNAFASSSPRVSYFGSRACVKI